MASKAKKPTGITISRKGVKFTVKWKHGEKYTKQDLDYRTKSSGGTSSWQSLSVTKSATSKAFEAVISNFKGSTFPTLNAVEVRVRGDASKKSWSDYGEKAMKLKKPPKPKIQANNVNDNTTNFAITKPSDTEKKPVSLVEYQYKNVTNFNKTLSDKTFPTSGVTTGSFTSGSKTVQIRTEGSLQSSETTVIRARTKGISGYSGWVYSKHIYANPYKPSNLKLVGKVTENSRANTTQFTLSWTAPSSQAYPIDETVIQYYIGNPVFVSEYIPHDLPHSMGPSEKGIRGNAFYYVQKTYGDVYCYDETLSPPDYRVATLDDAIAIEDDDWVFDELYHISMRITVPDGTQFTDAKTQKDTSGSDSATVTINSVVGVDQCLWAQVATVHDNNKIESNYIRLKTGILTAPTISVPTTDPETFKATVNVQNNSAVQGSFVALVYQDSECSEDSGKVIGVTSPGQTSISVQCPKWTGKEPITFGAYAVCGSINQKATETRKYTGLPDPVIFYSLNEKMTSPKNFKGGDVPVAPTNVTAEKDPDRDGTVVVQWDTPWLTATGAEISWADHDDAWYSTDGPTTYTVESTKKPLLHISNLEVGKIWYVCVRLFKQTDDGGTTYGPPSDIVPVDLAEAPAIPILTLSDSTIPLDREIKASWTYVSFDNKDQESAVLAEIVEGEEEPVEIRRAETEQFLTFTPNEENLNIGWELGSTHNLVVKVYSQGGKESSWSESVPLIIAEPPECHILETSLVKDTVDGVEGMYLTKLPMDVKITGANESDQISLFIRRYDDYAVERPDESDYIGYAGDSIVTKDINENSVISITAKDLENVGTQFDDGAKYQLIAMVQDVNGQVATNAEDEGIGQDGIDYLIPDPEITHGDPYFERTSDVEILEGKEYYNVVGMQVPMPREAYINTYYELTTETVDGRTYNVFSRTNDTTINPEKTYYAVSGIAVENPIVDDILAYYDKKYEPGPAYQYFTVNWEHQAIEPNATVEITEDEVAKIHIGNPVPPEGSEWTAEEGDHVDIYRLSAGKPQLIYPNAQFDSYYADPYPTIGKRGGYRIVFVTANGDYILKDDDGEKAAWIDITENASIFTRFQYIDFDDKRLIFKFNVKFSNSWKKNFTLTHYLSGKVEGDWLAGSEHTNNITGVTIDDLVDDDIDNGTLDDLYDLAEYCNMVHIRTIEGFNYPANIEVSDSSEFGQPEHPHDISLNITEVSNSEYDGVLWDKWVGDED